ncbi:DUF3499 family protein [Brachybacterium sp. JB7]|uniref:DUF3499 family protein n=1 Tax=Brachybacterium sp. JB7 TaxID=2024478 RepID=UPI001F5428A5|nr:DUF3499 family protein [Brachybacterium sp. JB7]
MSSLTFVYEDSTAVLGPLSRVSEPHAYDLCREHAAGMTAPRGWSLLRGRGARRSATTCWPSRRRAPARATPASLTPPRRAATRPAGASGAAHRARENAETGPRHLHVLRGPDD